MAVQAVLHGLDARVYRARPAPAPDNINWPALWRSNAERRWRRPAAFLLYTMIMIVPIGIFGGVLTHVRPVPLCLYAAPIGMIAVLPPRSSCLWYERPGMQITGILCREALEDGGEVPTAFEDFCNEDSFLRRVSTQILPAILVILWQNAIMPLALYSITLFESTHVSLSSLDARILMLFYWWNAVNLFFGSMIAGSLTEQLQTVIEDPGKITDVLGTSLPTSSNFFINYVALRAFGLVPFRLVLVHGGIWRWLGKCAPLHPEASC